jgi:hypothetical protein
MPYARIGSVGFAVGGEQARLAVYWLNRYAGGIFIPFRDGTSGAPGYGGGLHLWDSGKGRTSALMATSWWSTSTTPTTRRASTTPSELSAGTAGELADGPHPRR